MALDKVVLALHGALHAKYGDTGMARIGKALRGLVAADHRRGITSAVIHLDDAAEMAAYGGPAPATADARAVKKAVDRIVAVEQPHYIMLIGGPDVLPMVPITNPAYSGPDGDSDRHVPSELAQLSFDVAPAVRGGPRRRVHVVKGRPAAADAGGGGIVRLVAIVATEEDGRLLHVRRLHAR